MGFGWSACLVGLSFGNSCPAGIDKVRKCIYKELFKLLNIPYSICICLDCTRCYLILCAQRPYRGLYNTLFRVRLELLPERRESREQLNLTPIFLGMSIRVYRNSNIDCGIWQSLARAKKKPTVWALQIFLPTWEIFYDLSEFIPCGIAAADNWHLKILIADPDMPQS